jgi:hypothetical protein
MAPVILERFCVKILHMLLAVNKSSLSNFAEFLLKEIMIDTHSGANRKFSGQKFF